MKKLDVVIDRSKWGVPPNSTAKGYEEHEGVLLDGNDMMCCLGFVGRACGITKKLLLNKGLPEAVDSPRWPESFGTDNYDTVLKLANTNDSPILTNPIRERRIRTLGKTLGIRFSFVGRYLRKKKEA